MNQALTVAVDDKEIQKNIRVSLATEALCATLASMLDERPAFKLLPVEIQDPDRLPGGLEKLFMRSV